jgi:hypothetical protein
MTERQNWVAILRKARTVRSNGSTPTWTEPGNSAGHRAALTGPGSGSAAEPATS